MKVIPFKLDENKRLEKINKTIPIPFPKLNQHMLMVAPTNSGKSTIVGNLLLGPLQMKFDKVIFFSSTWEYDIYNKIFQIDDENIYTEYSDEALHNIMNEKERLEEEKEKKLFYLIIFDDMQEQFFKGSYFDILVSVSGYVRNMLTRYQRKAVNSLVVLSLSRCFPTKKTGI